MALEYVSSEIENGLTSVNYKNTENGNIGYFNILEIIEHPQEPTKYKFNIGGITPCDTAFTKNDIVATKDALETESTVDPAKVFYFVASVLKRIICPNCM